MDGLYEQLRIALHAVWMRKWLALGVAWGLCLAGWLVIALIPNSYESKARVYVDTPDMLPSSMANAPVDRRADLSRMMETLTSTENLQRVVRRTDLGLQIQSDKDMAGMVAGLRKAIKVTAQQDNVFEITASSAFSGFSNAQNARTAQAIVQSLIDGFIEGNAEGDRAQTGQTLSFLDDELKRRAAELRDAEQRRVDFETKYMGLLPGEGSIGQRMSAARTELTTLDEQLSVLQASLASARAQLAATPATVAGAGGEVGAAGQVAALQAQLSQLRARGWTDSHPDVIATKQQIARLQPQADAERRSGTPVGTPNPLYVSLRSMMAEKEAQAGALSARKQQLSADLAQLTDRQSAAPEVLAQEASLSRDYDVLKSQYDKLLQDREQIQLKGDVSSKTDALKFRVVQQPAVPNAPAKPNRPLLLTLVLFVGIGAGVAAAFAQSQLKASFPTQSRLEQVTGLPVLGSVSAIVSDAGKAVQRKRLQMFSGAGGGLFAAYLLLLVVEFWQRSQIA